MHNIISAEAFAKKSRLCEVRSNDNYVFWLEADPAIRNRQYLNCYGIATKQKISMTSPEEYNIRSGINEYGGGSYWLNNNRLYFFNKDNSAIYYIDLNQDLISAKPKPELVEATLPTNTNVNINYADGIVLPNNDFIAVRETIIKDNVYQQLVIYDGETNQVVILDDEHDFYAFARLNTNTNQLLWLSWEHPNMPWDKSTLHISNLTKLENKYTLINRRTLIEIPNNSLYQPEWLDHENIFLVSEHETNNQFWNLYLYNINNQQFTPVLTGQFELGLPLWQLATNTFVYKIHDENIDIFCYKMSHGQSILATCNISATEIIIHDVEDIPISYIQDTLCLSNGNLYFLASTSRSELSVYEYELKNKYLKVISNPALIETKDASIAQEIKFTNQFGMESYAFFYEPQPSKVIQDSTLPPLVVICHGGPTGTTNSGYNTKIQYWTSRGFAILDVNYSGSTTYGKKYRDRINFEWGVVDVADCAAAAQYLVDNNKVDAENIMIRGSSAGGLIVLLALLQYDIFSAGCCYYPVSDLVLLSEQIHNFEKFYNEFLIGNFKDHHQQYSERSPVNFAENLRKPILLFHGTEDKVIPIGHTRALFDKIKTHNKHSNYYEFAGEGHGFRNMNTIKSTLDYEYDFYLNTMKKSHY